MQLNGRTAVVTGAASGIAIQVGNGNLRAFLDELPAGFLAAKHGLIGLAKTVAKEGAEHAVRANVICPGFVRAPLVEKQIPEQASELDITEEDVIRNVMLKETVDGEFTTLGDVARCAVFLAGFPSNAPPASRSSWATAGRCIEPEAHRISQSKDSLE